MYKKVLGIGLLTLATTPSFAQFINGGFENGTTSGWTTGTGYRGNVSNTTMTPGMFLPGGIYYDSSLQHSAVVSSGVMAHTDGKLNQVYSGNYSFRAEDLTYGGYASSITQRVNNYSDTSIFFAWAATLEGAHGPTDAATFQLVLRDETTGTDIISRQYNAGSTGSGVDSRFASSADGFYYTTSWQVEQLSIDASLTGHDFSLTLLAADCEPTGHEGTVYLDGFGAAPPPVTLAVPEPETYALMLAGLGVVGFVARKRRRD